MTRAIELRDQVGEAFVQDRLRHAFIAAEPERDRGVMSITTDHIACVGEEERRILRFDLKVLRRLPEVVEHEHAVLIRQIVEDVFSILAHPVADDVEVRFLVQAKVRLEA